MKAAILILALIGSVIALQSPMEYKYKYEGRLASTIPGVRPQVAATGIRCLLTIQMKTKTQGIAKASEIEVGTYHGDDKCLELRDAVPLKWAPSVSPKLAKLLEEPFGVNFANEMGHVMTVGKEDTEFIVNIRKAMIEPLRIHPMSGHIPRAMKDHMTRPSYRSDVPEVYSVEEETIFGRCECQYTIAKLPLEFETRERKEIERTMKQDEQAEGSTRSGMSTVPELKDDLWRVIRSVDFGKCHDRVILQHSGISNMTRAGHGQMESAQSRSSIGSFILRGSPKNFRLERAIVEGDIVMNPFGVKQNRVQTITNQTLRIMSVSAITTPMRLPQATRNIRTWRYEVASPFAAPSGSPKPWVNYYNKNDRYAPVSLTSSILGMFPDTEDKQKMKADILKLLDMVTENIDHVTMPTSKEVPSPLTMSGSKVTTHLFEATKMMSALPLKDIEDIFSHVFQERDPKSEKKRMLLIDIAAASGASAPMKVLLEKMHSKVISNERIATIFMTLTNNLVSPAIIPDILRYAKTVDIEKTPFLASAVLINTASMVHRLCLNRMSYNYSIPHPIYGNMQCDNKDIIHYFLPVLQEKLKNAESVWAKAIALEAISNMGTTHVLATMDNYISDIRKPEQLRRIAIYALNRNMMSSAERERVFTMLMKIVDNLEEKSHLRQSAFVTLLTWHPRAVWWQRIARATWREPSQSFAALVTFTVQSLAESNDPYLKNQADIAAFALPLLKPFAPSTKYSYNYIYSRFDPISKMRVTSEFAYFENIKSSVPAEVYTAIKNSYGGFSFKLFEFAASQQNVHKNLFQLLNLLHMQESSNEGRNSYPRNPREPSSRSTSNVFYKMDTLGREAENNVEPYINVLVRAFDNINTFVPITAETIRKVAGPNWEELIHRLITGEKLNMIKYLNPMKVQYFLPTDIGIPVVGQLSLPTVNLGEAEIKLHITGNPSRPTFRDLVKAKEMHLTFRTNYRLMSKLKVSLKALLPFENVITESGVENYKEINLPLFGKLSFNNTLEVRNLTLNVEPYLPEFPVVYAHNIPFTVMRPLFLDHSKRNDFRPILLSNDNKPLIDKEINIDSKYTGIKSKIIYEADIEYPFTTAHFMDYLRSPELFMKLLASPTTKHWKTALLVFPKESVAKNISMSLSYMTPEISSSSPAEHVPDFSPLDTVHERLQKMRQLFPAVQVRAVEAQLVFTSNSVHNKYEAVFAVGKKEQSEIKTYRTMVALMANVPQVFPQECLCLETNMKTPLIKSYRTLQQTVEQSKMHEELNAKLFHGKTCSSSSPICTIEAEAKVSENRKSMVSRELESTCNVDLRIPVVKFQIPAIYDEVKMDLTFEKTLSIPKHLWNVTYTMEKMFEGFFYPHAYYNKMDVTNKPNAISIVGHRPVTSKFFTFRVHKPTENVLIREVYIPNLVSQIVPYFGLEVTSRRDNNFIIAASEPAEVCQLKMGEAITFDGDRYAFDPLHCYTTVLVNRADEEAWVLHTRVDESSNFEARLNIESENLEVIIRQHEAFVNGKKVSTDTNTFDIKDRNGRVIVRINRHKNSYEMNYLGKFDVTVNEQLTVVPTTIMKNMYRGLCGNFDGNKNNDKIGPKGCLYEDVELFKFSWAIKEGESCDEEQYDRKQTQINEFQQECPKPHHRGEAYKVDTFYDNKKDEDCLKSVYLIVSEGGDLCISEEAVLHCVMNCNSMKKVPVWLEAKCWKNQHIPRDVREARELGFLTHPESAPADYTHKLKFYKNEDCHRH